MVIRAYLRASSEDSEAERDRAGLEAFASERGVEIAARYVENVAGTAPGRPELFRLLRDARTGDILLIERVDRLSRLAAQDWLALRAEIDKREIRIVALDLPASWVQLDARSGGSSSIIGVNAIILDVLAAVARQDYEDRRRRQAQGQARAQAEGRYKGRPENLKRNSAIASMLRRGASWTQIQDATGCSRATIAKIARRVKAEDPD